MRVLFVFFMLLAGVHASEDTPILHIEKKDMKIIVKTGPKGTVYSVAPKKGKWIADSLTEAELKAKHPELYDFVKSAITATKGMLDASVSSGQMK